MDAKGVRNMYSIPVVVNKHNTARVASCWFIIYYRLVMHGNSNIKFLPTLGTLKQSIQHCKLRTQPPTKLMSRTNKTKKRYCVIIMTAKGYEKKRKSSSPEKSIS